MIKEFVERWEERKDRVKKQFERKHPSGYEDILSTTLREMFAAKEYDTPDHESIKVLRYGDYQGEYLFIVSSGGYAPDLWYTKVFYGSCSGCDTFLAIKGYGSSREKPSEDQVKAYMGLALNMIQKMKPIE